MKKREQMRARDVVDSFFKDVLANFFVIIFIGVLAALWITMA